MRLVNAMIGDPVVTKRRAGSSRCSACLCRDDRSSRSAWRCGVYYSGRVVLTLLAVGLAAAASRCIRLAMADTFGVAGGPVSQITMQSTLGHHWHGACSFAVVCSGGRIAGSVWPMRCWRILIVRRRAYSRAGSWPGSVGRSRMCDQQMNNLRRQFSHSQLAVS